MEIPTYKFALREDLKDTKDLFMPSRATPHSTGWDVKAAMKDRLPLELEFGQSVKIPLGFRTFCPSGWWYELKPRSSTFGKKSLHALYGTIDEDYEGELIFACQYIPSLRWNLFDGSPNFTSQSLKIEFGEAIGQIIPVRRQDMLVEGISNEEYDNLCSNRKGMRSSGGFGSTDKK